MKAKKEIIIGICVVLALFALFLGIDFLKGINIFKPANYYYATYTDVAGLQVSAPVTLNGYKVGQIREIKYEFDNPGHVKVQLSLDRELRLPEGTKAVITQDLLGTASVVLKPSSANTHHEIGTHLIGETASGMMESVSKDLMPAVNAIFPKIDSLLTHLNTIVADPALIASVRRLDDITLNLDRTMRSINRTTAGLPQVMDNVDTITVNLAAMSNDLAQLSAELKALPLDSTMQNITALSANLRILSQQLNDPNSSLGLITHDRALYDNLNNCAASLDSLLIDVKRNPKRYISIKLL